MQQQEFNNLMQGQPAKWAEHFKMQAPKNQSLNDSPEFKNDQPIKLTLIPGEPVHKVREKIKANEVPVPEHIRQEIYKFVKEEREKRVSERSIRRAVKRRWNIYVV